MSSKHIVQISPDNFSNEVKQSSTPVLVDFWAEWCGPCKAIAPMLDELAEAHVGKLKIAKVNVDQNQTLAAEYGIRAIPTLLIFKNGEIKEQMVGAVSKRDLEAKIASHLN
jgi:thioredoxin 1